jgi:hypothetical protein
MKNVRIVLSKDALIVYNYLKSNISKNNSILYKSINYKLNLLKENPQLGNPISKNKIPNNYVQKYGVNNLYRVELSLFWRMLYTLRYGDENTYIFIFLISIVNHKEYNKIFKYK